MLYKSLAFTCLIAGTVSIAGGQTVVPSPKAEGRAFAFSFSSEGGYLGIETVEVSNENFGKYGLPNVRGVAIEKVVEGSPAEKAGLRSGDVIVRLNSDEITSTRKLTRLVSEIAPDHTARITIFREGSERELSATVGKRPTPKFDETVGFSRLGEMPDFPMPPNAPVIEGLPRATRVPGGPVFAFGNRRQIGVGTTTLTKQLAENFGVDNGVMVSSVREGSPAAKAGLKAGDIIIEADGKAVKGDGDLIRVIAEKKEGDVAITYVRDRSRKTVNVMPEEVKGGPNTYFKFPDAPNAPSAPATPGIYSIPRPAIRAVPLPMGSIGFPRWVI
jgi:Trypsin-like serine proteases, typically periplasmic, contain C-terminal PDZ domain